MSGYNIPYGIFDEVEDILNEDTVDEDPPPIKKKDEDGSKCEVCKDFYQYAEPNTADNKFICRACKLNPYRCSPINPDDD